MVRVSGRVLWAVGSYFSSSPGGEALEAPAGNGQINDNFTEEPVIYHFPARMEYKTLGNKANVHIPFQRKINGLWQPSANAGRSISLPWTAGYVWKTLACKPS